MPAESSVRQQFPQASAKPLKLLRFMLAQGTHVHVMLLSEDPGGQQTENQNERCAAIKGLSTDHGRDSVSFAGPSGNLAELYLAGTGPCPAFPSAAQIPRFLAP